MCYKYGLGVAKDPETAARWIKKAVEWYLNAAESGNPDAQLFWGSYYYYLGLNETEGNKWYKKAAEQRHADALVIWAERCSHARSRDVTEAEAFKDSVKWLKRAAEQEHVHAQFLLGSCYAQGGNGWEKNEAEAVKWYRKAAAQDYKKAIDALSRLNVR